MASNFKIAVTELSKQLSLKEKKYSANLIKIEKPLSRNVRFLDLSTNNLSKGTSALGSARRIVE